jgi:hypothetical protein
VLRHLGISRIQLRLIETSFVDSALEVIRYQDVGNTLEVFKGMHMRMNPLRESLRKCSFSIGIIGGAPDRHKKLSQDNLAIQGIHEGETVTVIQKQLFPCPVLLAHNVVQFTTPAAVILTILRVLVAIRMLFFVLLP